MKPAGGTVVVHSEATKFEASRTPLYLNVSIECTRPIPSRGDFLPVYGVNGKINNAAIPELAYAGAVVYFLLDAERNEIVYIGESHSASVGRARKTILRHFQGFMSLRAEGPDPDRVRFRSGNATYSAMRPMEVAYFRCEVGLAFLWQTLLIQQLRPIDNGTDHKRFAGDLTGIGVRALVPSFYQAR